MKHSCLTTSMDAKLTEDGVMMQPTVHFVYNFQSNDVVHLWKTRSDNEIMIIAVRKKGLGVTSFFVMTLNINHLAHLLASNIPCELNKWTSQSGKAWHPI